MKIKFFSFLSLVLLFFIFSTNVFAQNVSKKEVVLVNPIRGNDFWNYSHDVLDTPKKQYELISKDKFSATWLVRYDALTLKNVQDFLKGLDPNQDIGIFMEITPTLANDAGVKYNQSGNWHQAKSVLLTGYSSEDRKKLIDTVLKKYNEVFSKNPKSVGAWWIDANSLSYLHDQYQVEVNLDVADQYSTDGYQVWGQYFSSPYYPSKRNALVPAKSEDKKIGIVTMQWATRDPFNGYGNGVFESTYSVQANDYMLHNLDSNYFSKLLDVYPQTTVGIENDFDFNKYGKEFEEQLKVITNKVNKRQVEVKSMVQFAQYYKNLYPTITPNVLISADDPLGGDGKVVWFNTPKIRLGWFYNEVGSVVRDLRLFTDQDESCLEKACSELKLAYTAGSAIDDVNYSSKWVLDDGTISDFSAKEIGSGHLRISYKNQGGMSKTFDVLDNDIVFNGEVKTFNVAIGQAVSASNAQMILPNTSFRSEFDFNKYFPKLINDSVRFSLLVILFFLLPGFVISRRKILAIPVGISLFTLVSFVAGYLKWEFLLWGLPLVSLILLLKNGLPKIYVPRVSKNRLVLGVLILLGSASWLVTQVKNGLSYNYGLGFWGPNGHDAIWHLSLISELQKNVPPNNPVFAGEKLSNYHYFFDLLVAKSANILGIDPAELLFRLFPVLISILIGLLVYKVSRKIYDSFAAGFWAVFFVYFGGSFGWVISYIRDRGFGGETMFWAQQAISTLLNPPFAVSVLIFLSGLLLFYEVWEQKNRNLKVLVPLVILWGSLIEFKAYAGILVLGALGLYVAEKVLFKRDFRGFAVFLPVLVLSLVVFLPNNLNSSSLVLFQPLWLIDSMIIAQDRLNWQRLILALQSGLPYKIVIGYLVGVVVFIAGNMGTRVVSFVASKALFEERFLFYFLILATVLPLLFIQKGNPWNIIQFFYYGLLIFNIFAGVGLGMLISKNKIVGLGLGIFLVIFTLPTTLGTFPQYLPDRPPAMISTEEVEALDFLKMQPEGVVLTLPFDEKLRQRFDTPVPLEVYASTSYVSAYSGHPTFLDDTINLEIIDVDYKGRLNVVRDFMRIKDQSKKIMNSNNITYLYVPVLYKFEIDEGRMGIKKIFSNKEVSIYKAL